MVDRDDVMDLADGSDRVLGWRTLGEGPALLLVNGYSGTATDWDPTFLATLAASRTVLAPDNQGMGRSSPGDLDSMSIDSMADDLVLLLDGLGIARAPVVGWSMGGMIAQAFALRNPGRVESLVLLGTDGGGPGAVLAEPTVWTRLVDHSGTPRQQASRLLSLLFPPEVASEADRLFGDVVAEARVNLSIEALSAQERAISAWHAAEPARPGPPLPPVLVATGTVDVVIPPANAALLAERWRAARVERFEAGGHAFMAQDPELLGTLIASFLDTVG